MKNKALIRDICIFIGLILLTSGRIFIREFNNLDEIWVFNNARCFAEGLLPYRDFSIITTPLFPMLFGTFLKIFGTELIVSRFLECFEVAIVLFIIYKILLKLEVNKGISLFAIILIYLAYSEVFLFDYNWAVIIITLITMYLELKSMKNEFSFKRDFLLGIFVRISNFI